VSVAYIQMTVQYNHILLLVTPYRTTWLKIASTFMIFLGQIFNL
jgi:hypothetical protein